MVNSIIAPSRNAPSSNFDAQLTFSQTLALQRADQKIAIERKASNKITLSDNPFADRITTPTEHQRIRALYDELESFIQGEKGFNTEPLKDVELKGINKVTRPVTTFSINPDGKLLPDRAAALNAWIDWVFDGRSTIDEIQYNKALFFRYSDPRYSSIENFEITQGTVRYYKPGESFLTKDQVYNNLERQLAMQHPRDENATIESTEDIEEEATADG